MNEHHKIMTEHLTKRFVDHRGIRLAPERIAKLPLEHGKGAFDVRPLVVMLQKLISLEHEIVVHLLPQSAAFPGNVAAERNKRCRVNSSNRVGILGAPVSLI